MTLFSSHNLKDKFYLSHKISLIEGTYAEITCYHVAIDSRMARDVLLSETELGRPCIGVSPQDAFRRVQSEHVTQRYRAQAALI